MTLPLIPRLRLRWAIISGGLAVFVWLRLEDNTVAVTALLALILAALALAAWLWPRLAGQPLSPAGLTLRLALAGAAAGLLTVTFTLLLMLLKNGFHGHLYPDYPALLLAGILARAPVWAVAGALGGLGAALALLARRSTTG